MRILHVIRTLDPAWGGPVEGLKSLTKQARANGLQVEIACMDEPDSPWAANWDFPVHAVGGVSTKLGHAVRTYGRSRNFDRWLASNTTRFDAIVVQGIWMYFSYAVWKAATKAKVPYFLFIHGALDPWFQEYYPSKNPKKKMYWRLFEHKVLRDANAVVFTTEEEKVRAHNAFLPYECKPVVVGYGVPMPPIDGRNDKLRSQQELTALYPELNNRPYFLYLGRIHEKKGIDLLLKGYAQAKTKLNGTALVVAGPGDPATVAPFKQLSAELAIEKDVVWTGPLYKSQKWLAMQGTTAFLLPSHQENFGISVVEALACGAPVLISDKVNIWREVLKSEAGLVEPDTFEGTTKLFQRWAGLSVTQQNSMSVNAHKCFECYFDITKNSSRFFNMLKEEATAHAETALAAAV